MRTVKLDVPAWFLDLGKKTDAEIAKDTDLPVIRVASVRRALGISTLRDQAMITMKRTRLLPPKHRWRRYNRFKSLGVPRELWPDALGFTTVGAMSAADCMEEWLYSRRNGLSFNALWPNKPKFIKRQNGFFKPGPRRFRTLPSKPTKEVLKEDDTDFEVGS